MEIYPQLAQQKRSVSQWARDILSPNRMLDSVALKILRDLLEVRAMAQRQKSGARRPPIVILTARHGAPKVRTHTRHVTKFWTVRPGFLTARPKYDYDTNFKINGAPVILEGAP